MEYSEKLEESVKLLRTNIKAQMKKFDKLRLKYVKLANQNKALFELNEKLKTALKEHKEKLAKYDAKSPSSGNEISTSRCKACGSDLHLQFTSTKPSSISIKADRSSYYRSDNTDLPKTRSKSEFQSFGASKALKHTKRLDKKEEELFIAPKRKVKKRVKSRVVSP